tara:strand:- start:42 stop:473 length:432 start_codon:yes stop_codon:yes gene_type:complete
MDNSSREPKPLPGPEDIQALLEFLPIFEKPDFVFGEEVGLEKQDDGTITLPHYTMSLEARRFRRVLHDCGFIRSFDWGKWKHEAVRYMDEPSSLETADLDTLCKLLTLHVRQERFCDGHLASMYECGHLTAILRQMVTILDRI